MIARLRETLGVEVPLRGGVRSAARWRPWRCGWRLWPREGRRAAAALRRSSPMAAGGGGCRCRSRRSGSGSSTSWSRASPAYNMAATVRLRRRLDVAALAGALGELVRRQQALRTTFRRRRRSGPAPCSGRAGESGRGRDLTALPAARAGGRVGSSGFGGGAAAVRPRRRSAAADVPVVAGAGRSRLLLANLHHIVARRLVDRSAGARAGGALRAHCARGPCRRCRSCRCSTGILRCGSGSGCMASGWRSGSATGGSGWAVSRRSWRCLSTCRRERWRTSVARCGEWRWRRPWRRRCGVWENVGAAPSSWCWWRVFKPCCSGTAAKTTWWWARRLPTVRVARLKI